MKIVVMSDTHLSRLTDGFMAVCDRYCNDADLVIHLGDWERSLILDYMEQYPLEAVSGNMDDSNIRSRLPGSRVIRVKGRRIGLAHGWGASSSLRDRLRNEFENVDCILFGHTHQPLQLEEDGVYWFNPGSLTAGRGGFPGSLGVLHVEERIYGEIIPV